MFQSGKSLCSFLMTVCYVTGASAVLAEPDRLAAAVQRLSAAKHEGEGLLAYYKEDVKSRITEEVCPVRKFYIEAQTSFNSLIDAMVIELQQGEGLGRGEHEGRLSEAEDSLAEFIGCVEQNEANIPPGGVVTENVCFAHNGNTSCTVVTRSESEPIEGPEVNTDFSELGVVLGEGGMRGAEDLNRMSEAAKAEIIGQLEGQRWRPYSDV